MSNRLIMYWGIALLLPLLGGCHSQKRVVAHEHKQSVAEQMVQDSVSMVEQGLRSVEVVWWGDTVSPTIHSALLPTYPAAPTPTGEVTRVHNAPQIRGGYRVTYRNEQLHRLTHEARATSIASDETESVTQRTERQQQNLLTSLGFWLALALALLSGRYIYTHKPSR